MSGPEAKNPAPAGISSPEEIDVAALYERLREELRRGAVHGDSRGAEFAATRALAERFWPVTAEREAGGGPKGIVKRVLRKFMRWYVEPLAADQRVFNDSVAQAARCTLARGADLGGDGARAGGTARSRAAGTARAARAARPARVAAAPMTVASQPAAAAVPDYFAFESRMRGSADAIRERQRRYVDDLREPRPVLDIGCGRGELARPAARGGHRSARHRRRRRHGRVRERRRARRRAGGPVAYLEALADGTPRRRSSWARSSSTCRRLCSCRLPRARRAKLRPGGVLIAETINPLSPIALRNYFADLTHAQPLVPETLELLARQAGFAATRSVSSTSRPSGSTSPTTRSSPRTSGV